MNFSRWLTVATLALVAAPACSEEPYQALTADAGAGSGQSACDSCGGRHIDACRAQWDACEADPGCLAIRECVFDYPVGTGQPPRQGGACVIEEEAGPAATCVDACGQAECTTTASLELYLAAERCTYCEFCPTECTDYCAALPTAPTCPN